MRKFILSIFALLLASVPAHAANPWDIDNIECPIKYSTSNPYDQECPAGCYYNSYYNTSGIDHYSSYKCLLCPHGHYCPGGFSAMYEQCPYPWTKTPEYPYSSTIPGDAPIDYNLLSDSIEKCFQKCDEPQPVTLGKIGVEKVAYNTDNKTCENSQTLTCVPNAEDNGTGKNCTCKAGFDAGTNNTECKASPYKITLDFNGVQVDGKTKLEEYHTHCGSSSFSTAQFSTDEKNWTSTAYIPKTSWVKTFEGYFTAKTGGEQKINTKGQAYTSDNKAIQCLTTDDKTTLTLYAHWTTGTYTIVYNYQNTNTDTAQECKANETCTVAAFDPKLLSDQDQIKGQIFKYWKCTSETNACPSSTIEAGYKITTPPNPEATTAPVLTLEPELEDCPEGYYCPNWNAEKCPKGTTSDKGAKSINGCFIGGGITQFKNADGSNSGFTLSEKYYLVQ